MRLGPAPRLQIERCGDPLLHQMICDRVDLLPHLAHQIAALLEPCPQLRVIFETDKVAQRHLVPEKRVPGSDHVLHQPMMRT